MPETKDTPRDFVYFIDYDKETGAVNVFAAVTNYGMFGHNTPEYGINKQPEAAFRHPAPGYRHHGQFEGYGATFPRDNSSVSWCGAVREALGPEIPRRVAEKIHPRLFERMESDEERNESLT